jgi:60S ribosomal subunit assembly/export protein LOC1
LPGKGIGDGGLEARLKKKFGKSRKVYTEKELGIPELNGIVPVGVEKPKGGKKGKVFVDDRVCAASRLDSVA